MATVLTDADIRLLKEMVTAFRSTPRLRPPRDIEELDITAPDVYLGVAPLGGLPAYSGVLAAVPCPVYKIVAGVIVPAGFYRPVINVGGQVAHGYPFLMYRDKFGTWFATGDLAGTPLIRSLCVVGKDCVGAPLTVRLPSAWLDPTCCTPDTGTGTANICIPLCLIVGLPAAGDCSEIECEAIAGRYDLVPNNSSLTDCTLCSWETEAVEAPSCLGAEMYWSLQYDLFNTGTWVLELNLVSGGVIAVWEAPASPCPPTTLTLNVVQSQTSCVWPETVSLAPSPCSTGAWYCMEPPGTGTGTGTGGLTRTPLGTASTVGTTLTKTVTAPAGLMVVAVFADFGAIGVSSVTFDGAPLTQRDVSGYLPYPYRVAIYYGTTVGGLANIVVNGNGPMPIMLAAESITGLTFNGGADASLDGNAGGVASAPDSGVVGPSGGIAAGGVAGEYVYAAIGMGTPPGSIVWQNGFNSSGQDVSQTISAVLYTLSTGYKVLHADATVDAKLSAAAATWGVTVSGYY